MSLLMILIQLRNMVLEIEGKPNIDDAKLANRNTAENGNKDSLYFLGLFYYYGNGVTRSRSKAVEYFTEAAKLGHGNKIKLG